MSEEQTPKTDPVESPVETPKEESTEKETEGAGNVEDTTEEKVANLTLEELQEVSGREFKTKEEFVKHYENLKSFVGKGEEKPEENEALNEVQQLKERLDEKDFILENPKAKDSLELVKTLAKANGVSYQEAWDKHLKEMAEGYQSYKEETDIGVKSKNRLNPMQSQNRAKLIKQAKAGNAEAGEKLVGEMLGL